MLRQAEEKVEMRKMCVVLGSLVLWMTATLWAAEEKGEEKEKGKEEAAEAAPEKTPEKEKPPARRKIPITLNVKETSLGAVHPGADLATLTVSQDSRRVAYAAKADRMISAVILDGQVASKRYNQISEVEISPDNTRIAYAVQLEDSWFVMSDKTKGKPYEEVKLLRFSPDSRRLAYAGMREGKWTVVVDGVEGYGYSQIGTIVFSPDSKRVAYVAIQVKKSVVTTESRGKKKEEQVYSQKCVVVVDGTPSKEYDNVVIGTVQFSPDSKHIAYAAQDGKKFFIVMDGEASDKLYDGIGQYNLLFSPGGSKLAYVARSGWEWTAIVKDKEGELVGEGYDAIANASLRFSPNGKRLGYAAQREKRWFAVVDDVSAARREQEKEKERQKQKEEVKPLESPGKDEDLQSTLVKPKAAEEESLGYDYVGPVSFSPDSKRYAYAAVRKKKGLSPTLSDEEKEKQKVVVVVTDDGEEGPEYGQVEWICFSPDIKHIAYRALRKNTRNEWVVVVDGVETTKKYDTFIRGSKLMFDSSTELHTLACRENEIFLVDVEIVEGGAVK